MRFLADENFPLASVRSLRAHGIDIQTIIETHPGISDHEVIEKAREQERIILTFDLDFGEIVFKSGIDYEFGIVLFRLFPYTPIEPAEIFERIIQDNTIQFRGYFTVVHRDHIRQKPIPDRDKNYPSAIDVE